MKYVTSAGSHTSSDPSRAGETRLHGLRAFQQTHQSSVSRVQSGVLALDGSRLSNLLEDCRFRYGRSARERARTTLHRWRDGVPVFPDDATDGLFTLVARQMTPAEKLSLIRDLWQQWVADLPRDSVSMTVVQGSDLLALARRVAGSVRRVPATLPPDLVTLLSWLSDADAQALGAIALGAERWLITQRMAAMLVHLGTLARLRALSSPLVAVRVQAHLEVPTLTVTLRIQPCFWRQATLPSDDTSGQCLLLHLQEKALLPTAATATSDFAAQTLDNLSPRECDQLTALATAVGLQTKNLLREIQAQTLAARADIEATAKVAERIRSGRLRGRVISEQTSSGCTSRIEIRHALCPIARLASLRR